MKNVRCPICDREFDSTAATVTAQLPFCGERCRLIDLGRWLGERYRLEDTAPDDDSIEVRAAELDPP